MFTLEQWIQVSVATGNQVLGVNLEQFNRLLHDAIRLRFGVLADSYTEAPAITFEELRRLYANVVAVNAQEVL